MLQVGREGPAARRPSESGDLEDALHTIQPLAAEGAHPDQRVELAEAYLGDELHRLDPGFRRPDELIGAAEDNDVSGRGVSNG